MAEAEVGMAGGDGGPIWPSRARENRRRQIRCTEPGRGNECRGQERSVVEWKGGGGMVGG
uniref:Uncharacterized protein n=1 Tax=Leersia perrieri TaxID=77586 RepID=A0A0D9WDX2_9ORYZ